MGTDPGRALGIGERILECGPVTILTHPERSMADFEYVACPKCHDKFMAGEEFFRLPQAYCHCPYCGNEFPVGVAAGEASKASDKRAGS